MGRYHGQTRFAFQRVVVPTLSTLSPAGQQSRIACPWQPTLSASQRKILVDSIDTRTWTSPACDSSFVPSSSRRTPNHADAGRYNSEWESPGVQPDTPHASKPWRTRNQLHTVITLARTANARLRAETNRARTVPRHPGRNAGACSAPVKSGPRRETAVDHTGANCGSSLAERSLSDSTVRGTVSDYGVHAIHLPHLSSERRNATNRKRCRTSLIEIVTPAQVTLAPRSQRLWTLRRSTSLASSRTVASSWGLGIGSSPCTIAERT